MLLNLSYNDPKVDAMVNETVGMPFSLKNRILLKGIGSGRFYISQASAGLLNILVLDQNVNWCNVEMRPRGIIVRFRKLLETYAFVVPYHKLTLYKTDFGYSLHKDAQFLTLQAADSKELKKFMDKIISFKANYLTDQPDF
ncbi:MAG: hypothetical protein KKC03_06025 [Bacteroidetes bacterium]|nr:hypothetical protein [Bacteroidota bacterium]